MKNLPFIKVIVLSFAFVFSGSISFASCDGPLVGVQYDRMVNGRTIDQTTFNAAVLHFTNNIRCQRGRRPFATQQDVLGAATTHARNMASTQTYAHNLNIRRAGNLRERLQTQNSSFRTAAENISKTFVYYLNGISFIQSGQCNFRYTANNQPIPVHTYRTLADELVTSWYNSPDHRANILSRRLDRMGAGLGIVKNTPLCGELYAAQVFAG
ncbi:MAG: CAP domain-containing protein [Rhodobacteraceae bacterium]|nr:CAP domain-containing protein [Paracoccaceae bacterium]